MTQVRELIEQLSRMNPSKEVYLWNLDSDQMHGLLGLAEADEFVLLSVSPQTSTLDALDAYAAASADEDSNRSEKDLKDGLRYSAGQAEAS